ncbi:hypothetical protein SKAU_G00089540 [Synaphobranchus kaupii]|uniref:Uncharacterized protein n=1 Tax=Synaphobranchus kaupii TaxID=118154 RepID=A0A9Q1J6B0_SYNKA|nr:hypothetical protein SKAU_G00089540 [Synaphobranchus kaupii]
MEGSLLPIPRRTAPRPPPPHPSSPRPPLDNSGSNPPAPHASVVLETSCSSEGPAEGDRCVGTCHPPPVPPRPHPLLPRVADKDNCPASDGVMDVVGLLDSLIEVPAGDRKGEQLPFQVTDSNIRNIIHPSLHFNTLGNGPTALEKT